MELPSHPEAADTGHSPKRVNQASWRARLFIAVVIALFVMMVILHLTGVVGPAGR